MSDICMFGLQKAGKTSIIKVIFQKMNAQQTYMLDQTLRMEIVPVTMSPYIKFNILDFPGSYDLRDPSPPELAALDQCGVMIFVLDVLIEPYTDAVRYLVEAMLVMQKRNANCLYHVFVHKADPESWGMEDKKNEVVGILREMVSEELAGSQLKDVNIDYHLTTQIIENNYKSIYDHCLFEQFSKVVQKIVPQVTNIQFLLDQMNVNCKIEKSYLFEIVSKLYLASDSSPIDLANFQLCSEMIDVYIDISFIYGSQNQTFQDNKSSAFIKLSDGTILLFKEVEKFLALICIIKQEHYDRPFLIDFNIDVFKQGLSQLLNVKDFK